VLVLSVGAAAALGAVLRYLVDRAVQARTAGVYPWGTLTVNVVGSLVLGVVVGLGAAGRIGTVPTDVLGAGLCGGLTTFSTWSYETFRLLEEGLVRAAGLNVAISLTAGLGAAGAGLALGSWI
jgi:CrcB protein